MRVRGIGTLVPLLLIVGLLVSLPILLDGGDTIDPRSSIPGRPDDSADAADPIRPPPALPDEEPASLHIAVSGDAGAADPGPGAWVALTGFEGEVRGTLDPEGNYHFEDLPPGKPFDIWLGPDPKGVWIQKLAADVRLRSGEEKYLAFVVPVHAEIRGKVVDEKRRPLEGARVAVLPPRIDWRTRVPVAAVTGPDGCFYIGFGAAVRKEPLRLVVDHVSHGFVIEERIVDPAVTGPRADVVVKLTQGLRIAGNLVGPDGEPIPGAEIHLLEEYDGDPDVRRPTEGLVTTDDEGHFEDGAYRAGVYRVVATGEFDGAPFAVVKPGVRAGDERVRLRFAGFGSLQLIFVDEASGSLAPPVRGSLDFVFARAGEEGETSAVWAPVFDEAEHTYPRLPEGHYRVFAERPSRKPIVSDLIFVPAGGSVGPIRYGFREE